jgi:flagellar protein FliJ
MLFRFSLQAVLRYRESFEQRERLRLQMITRELVKARQQCDEARQERVKAREDLAGKLAQGTTAAELHLELACDTVRGRRIAALQELSGKFENLRQRQAEAFRKAQQQRKILENLRARQLAAYRVVQNRRTQQQLDEMFLMRPGREANA